MKSKKLKNLAAFVAFLLIVAAVFSLLSYVLRDKRYAANAVVIYKEPKDSIDVLLVGSSHMLNGVFPMELWRTQGIAAANMAQNGQIIPETYYALMESFRYQSPRVVVLDVYKMVESARMGLTVSFHFTVDSMRLGAPKLKAVFDLVPEEQRAEYLIDIIAYHTRWKELTAADFRPLDASMKGSEALFSVYSNADYEIPAQSETAQLNETALSYLEKIIALCDEHGAQLVLTALPFGDAHEDAIPRQQTANAVEQYAREHGIPFLNYIYLNDETGLDMAADFANIDHLNARGAVKISQHLAGYLKENYDLPDRRDDGAYRAWNDDCASYEQMLKDGWGAEAK